MKVVAIPRAGMKNSAEITSASSASGSGDLEGEDGPGMPTPP